MSRKSHSRLNLTWQPFVLAMAMLLSLAWAGAVWAQGQDPPPRVQPGEVSMLPVAGKEARMLDTLNIRFHVNRTDIELDFADNEAHIDTFIAHFRERYAGIPADSLKLDIYAGASPEGTFNDNLRLGQGRGEALRDLLRERLKGEIGHFRIINEGGRWRAFYNAVWKSEELWRNEVLYIIQQKPGDDPNARDPRETKLREMWGGMVWPDVLENYLAPLRSSGSAIVGFFDPVRDAEEVTVDATLGKVPPIYVIYPDSTGRYPGWPAATGSAYSEAPAETGGPIAEEAPEEGPVVIRLDTLTRFYDKCWALKTNFLLWGVVAPNVQAEFPLGSRNRWSVELEYFQPWFIWADNARAHQCLNLGVELRYWLGKRWRRPWLDGWHIGLAAATGYYDFEVKKHEGYQGEHVNTYLNLGYQHRFSRHWAIDMGIGAGALITKNRHYYGGSVYPEEHLEPRDEHLIWHDNKKFNWIGPNHAHLSIVYTFNYPRSASRSEKIRSWRESRAQAYYDRKWQKKQDKKAKAEAKAQRKIDKENKPFFE